MTGKTKDMGLTNFITEKEKEIANRFFRFLVIPKIREKYKRKKKEKRKRDKPNRKQTNK